MCLGLDLFHFKLGIPACVPLCEYVHVSAGAQGGQRWQISLELGLEMVISNTVWVLGVKVRPLKEQYVFLATEPSFQLLSSIIVGHMYTGVGPSTWAWQHPQKSYSLFFSSQQLPVAPWFRGWSLRSSSATHAEILTGLISCKQTQFLAAYF